ncbi:MAG TPA: glycine zipper 2TM domain-containing protein [Mizugakiibacter sp.]
MKRCAISLAVAVAACVAAPVLADPPPWAPAHGRRAKHHDHEVYYDYARVVEVVPMRAAPRQQCYEVPVQEKPNTTAGTVLGAVVGGVLGNTVGKGDGRKAATVAGAVVGGVVGHEIAANQAPREGYRRECREVAGAPSAYEVTYEYEGARFQRRLDYDPGSRVRVRVDDDVVPAGRDDD